HHNRGILKQEQSVPVEAAHLATTLETGSRVVRAAVRRRRFLRCDRVQPRSDVDRLAGEIWRALLLLLRMWSRGRGSTPRRMDQRATARRCLDGKWHRARASRPGSAAHNPARLAQASVGPVASAKASRPDRKLAALFLASAI